MTEIIKPPTDNFYKFVTVIGIALIGLCILGLVKLGALDEKQQSTFLWIGAAFGGVLTVGGAYFWKTRTQTYQDSREKTTLPDANEQANEAPTKVAVARAPWEIDVADLEPNLPSLPDPCVQSEFTATPVRFWIDLRSDPPALHIAFWAVNMADAPLAIMDIIVTRFYVSCGDTKIEIREPFNSPGKRSLGRKARHQYIIQRTLKDYRDQCETLKRATEYHASLAIEIHGRRGSTPFEYICSDFAMNGVIERKAAPSLPNSKLAAIASQAGDQGKSVQQLIEAGGSEAVLRELGAGPSLILDGDLLKLAKALAQFNPKLEELVERSEEAQQGVPKGDA